MPEAFCSSCGKLIENPGEPCSECGCTNVTYQVEIRYEDSANGVLEAARLVTASQDKVKPFLKFWQARSCRTLGELADVEWRADKDENHWTHRVTLPDGYG